MEKKNNIAKKKKKNVHFECYDIVSYQKAKMHAKTHI